MTTFSDITNQKWILHDDIFAFVKCFNFKHSRILAQEPVVDEQNAGTGCGYGELCGVPRYCVTC